ncbi:hypothetical protein ABT174_18235 [Streptomyces sparsogenes]|uniref:hypothetical protein n=1 Tax=Streptomyces sparsogenes TaxID=67365 RepID=UPI0033197A01
MDRARLSGETGTACRLAADRLTREWERPWPWIQLGLALLRPSTTAAAEDGVRTAAGRAITHRPEVVRALYAQVTKATGKAPDPVLLAAWTGAGDRAGDILPLPLTDAV